MAIVVKNPPVNTGDLKDTCSIPGSGRYPGGGHATHSSVLAWRILLVVPRHVASSWASNRTCVSHIGR